MSESGSPNNAEPNKADQQQEEEEEKPERDLPKNHLESGTWPDGPLKDKPPNEEAEPPNEAAGPSNEAEVVRQICQTLVRAIEAQGLSNRKLARLSRIGPATLQHLLRGESWALCARSLRWREPSGLVCGPPNGHC